jgi:hypothetical protein
MSVSDHIRAAPSLLWPQTDGEIGGSRPARSPPGAVETCPGDLPGLALHTFYAPSPGTDRLAWTIEYLG